MGEGEGEGARRGRQTRTADADGKTKTADADGRRGQMSRRPRGPATRGSGGAAVVVEASCAGGAGQSLGRSRVATGRQPARAAGGGGGRAAGGATALGHALDASYERGWRVRRRPVCLAPICGNITRRPGGLTRGWAPAGREAADAPSLPVPACCRRCCLPCLLPALAGARLPVPAVPALPARPPPPHPADPPARTCADAGTSSARTQARVVRARLRARCSG